MQTIETKVYEFNELSNEAKERARQWWLEGQDNSWPWETTVEDAKEIGLKIASLDDHRANSGGFMDDAVSCAKAIVENHGKDCETYKTAKAFLLSMDSLNAEHPEDADGDRGNEYDEEKEELEKEFLRDILEDYRIMFNKDCEYQQSNEVVDGIIEANGYTFTEDGKRFG